MNFKFLPGQCVEFCPMGSLVGRYRVLRLMPVEAHHEEPCYRIKGELRDDEWVVTECNLDANVGTPHDYVLIAQQLRDQRQRRSSEEVSTESSLSDAFRQSNL